MAALIILGALAVFVVACVVIGLVINNASDRVVRAVAPGGGGEGLTFQTSLSTSDALAAARQAATATGSNPQDHASGLSVIFPSGHRLDVRAAPHGPGTRLRLKSVGMSKDRDAMARFRGALLASLREGDPDAKQAR